MSRPPRAQALSLWKQLEDEYERYQEAVKALPMHLLKVQDDLRRYLCLRCAGFLEQVAFEVLTGYLEQKSSGPIQNFAKSFFKKAPNMNASAFIKLIDRFGDAHSHQFSDFLTAARKTSLSDLLEIRNDVAHGKLASGARLQPERYVQLCEDVYYWLIETFLADSVEVLDDDGRTVIARERTV